MAGSMYHYVPPAPGPKALPILISCPHVGTEIPDDIAGRLTPNAKKNLPDTDWFVDELYGFAKDLGIGLIAARFSRYVVDLNRPTDGARLYQDQRPETGVVPLKTFAQDELYTGSVPDQAEIDRRISLYYQPYHQAVATYLDRLSTSHRHVLLFEAHSIKRLAAPVVQEPLSDVILGDVRGQSAHPRLSASALVKLSAGEHGLSVAHNQPFMGGHLTRLHGRPDSGRHALQLEMCQDIYMNADTNTREPHKMARVQGILRDLFPALAKRLAEL